MTDDLKYTLARIISGQNQETDWNSLSNNQQQELVALSLKEGLGPLLYWHLSKAGQFSSLPTDIRDNLRAMYARTWMQNRQIFQELENISVAFEKAGIPVVVLKGACFALTVYEDIGLRPMVDLDLLVPETELPKAIEITKYLGYKEIIPEVFPGIRNFLKQEIELYSANVKLELHNSLLVDRSFTYYVPADWFFKQTAMIEALPQHGFKDLRALSPEANILYLAAHTILKHGPRQAILRQFFDIDRVFNHYSSALDWEVIIYQAKKFEWSSALYEALSDTCRYFSTPIPPHILSALAAVQDRHQKLISSMKSIPATRTLEAKQTFSALKWYGKFLLIWVHILPAPAYMRWRYGLRNNWFLPAWYLIRWAGILKDAFLTLVSLAGKKI